MEAQRSELDTLKAEIKWQKAWVAALGSFSPFTAWHHRWASHALALNLSYLSRLQMVTGSPVATARSEAFPAIKMKRATNGICTNVIAISPIQIEWK